MPIRDACSPVNKMTRGTPITNADPAAARPIKRAPIYDRSSPSVSTLPTYRPAPEDPDPFRDWSPSSSSLEIE
jgi:hypothetical protein